MFSLKTGIFHGLDKATNKKHADKLGRRVEAFFQSLSDHGKNISMTYVDEAVPDELIKSTLNQREQGIFQMRVDGISNKEIAARMDSDIRTIRMELAEMGAKLEHALSQWKDNERSI